MKIVFPIFLNHLTGKNNNSSIRNVHNIIILTSLQKMSSNTTEFQCKHANCRKNYSSRYNLRRHIEATHKKIKRFRCKNCGKYLSSKQNLQEHIYIHSQAKPYQCLEADCGKIFRQSSQLSNHRKFHKELMLINQKQHEFKELRVKTI